MLRSSFHIEETCSVQRRREGESEMKRGQGGSLLREGCREVKRSDDSIGV